VEPSGITVHGSGYAGRALISFREPQDSIQIFAPYIADPAVVTRWEWEDAYPPLTR
jgi:hypothetical protein